MNIQRILVFIISIIGIYVSLNTWVRLGPFEVKGSAGDGWFTAIAFGLCALLAIIGKFKAPFGLIKNIVLSLLSACAIAVMIISTRGIEQNLNTSHELFSYAWGFYTVFAAAILIPVVGWTMSFMQKDLSTHNP